MNNAWGNGSSGPGGDQSWLGGSDRDGSASSGSASSGSEGSGGGWSSDFGDSAPGSDAPDGQVPDQRMPDQQAPDQQAPEYRGPDFGGRAGQDGSSRPDGGDSGWAAGFTGAGSSGSSSDSSGSGKGMAAVLIGALTSVVGIVIFAVIAYKMGMDLWWAVLFVGIPLIRRVGRSLRRVTRR